MMDARQDLLGQAAVVFGQVLREREGADAFERLFVGVSEYHKVRCSADHMDGRCLWFRETRDAFRLKRSSRGRWLLRFEEEMRSAEEVVGKMSYEDFVW